MVGSHFVLHKTGFMSSWLGIDYAEEIIDFAIPSVNGYSVMIDIKIIDSEETADL